MAGCCVTLLLKFCAAARDRAALAGDAAKKLVQRWFAERRRRAFIAGIGGQCAVAGGYLVKMVHLTTAGGVAGSLLRTADW